MEYNPLRTWLFSTDKIVKDSSKREVTHYMLDGGKLDITENYEIFQEMYAKNIVYKNCIVEKKTEIFRFFIDFDVLASDIIDISEYVIHIQNTMSSIYKDSQIKCIITKANTDKETYKDSKKYYKQGFHLNWPDILVNKDVAMRIRDAILIKIKTIFGKPDNFYDSWEKIIDKCVYDKNGLRLIGSDKCTYSDGNYIYENRHYVFYSCYIGDKVSEYDTIKYNEDILKTVIDTSIRSQDIAITLYYDLPEYVSTCEDVDKSKTEGFITLTKEDPERVSIEKFFRNHVKSYRVEDIRTVVKSKNYSLFLINTKSKYCQNKCGFHSNNHIYFKLTPIGICQMCMSENDGEPDEEGNSINCSKFESKCIPLTQDVKTVLNWGIKKTYNPADKSVDSLSLMMQRIDENLSNKREIKPIKKTKKK